jgi:hypothetical protein
MPAHCDECRQLFAPEANDTNLADRIEEKFPKCECEACTVGVGSPGPVTNNEALHRFTVSPRDIDPLSGTLRLTAFNKVFDNGLSVCRDVASDEEVISLTDEILGNRAGQQRKSVSAVYEASVKSVRLILDAEGERVFGVYDQSILRFNPENPPVPTHAGIFQRRPPKGVENRTALQKDLAYRLRELFEQGRLNLAEYRGGVLLKQNARAGVGDFEQQNH